jgi:hypothetical protein
VFSVDGGGPGKLPDQKFTFSPSRDIEILCRHDKLQKRARLLEQRAGFKCLCRDHEPESKTLLACTTPLPARHERKCIAPERESCVDSRSSSPPMSLENLSTS